MISAMGDDEMQDSSATRDEEFAQPKEVIVVDSQTGEMQPTDTTESAPVAEEAPQDNHFKLD